MQFCFKGKLHSNIFVDRQSKYFFMEQLKILSKIIQESAEKPKVKSSRMEYAEISQKLETLYSNQFEMNTTRIETCEVAKSKSRAQINPNTECNHWGEWESTSKCAICGESSYTEERKCYNHDKTVQLSDEFCEKGASTRVQNCLDQPKCPEYASSWTCDSCPDKCWGPNQPDQYYSCKRNIVWHGFNNNQYPMETITKVKTCGKAQGTPNRHQIGRCKRRWGRE